MNINDFHVELQKLIADGKIVKYSEMPETHQLAIAHYMSVDGAAWAYDHPEFEDWIWGEGTPYDPQMRQKMLADLHAFLPRFVRHFGNEQFGMATVSCKELHEVIMKVNPHFNEDDVVRSKRGAYDTPTWPSILVDSNEILQDGWTRFYDRISLGIETTPVVWYA